MQKTYDQFSEAVLNWVRPDRPSETALPVEAAAMLTDRNRFVDLLPYREVSEDNIVFLDDPNETCLGFMLDVSPLLGVGTQVEVNLESLIGNAPAGSVLQFYAMSTPQIKSTLDAWVNSQQAGMKNPVMAQMVKNRYDFFRLTAVGPSMLPSQKLHPRNFRYYYAVRIPYTGGKTDNIAFNKFYDSVRELQGSMAGTLQGAGLATRSCNENDIKFMLRELLNPHLTPDERLKRFQGDSIMHKDLVEKSTRVTVNQGGVIGFAEEEGEPQTVVVPLTVDSYPSPLTITATAMILGNPLAWDERINTPFVAYTNIQILESDSAKEKLQAKQGVLAKQTMSDSGWYRSLMGHLFERKAAGDALLKDLRDGRRAVRAYCGMNLYCTPDNYRLETEQAISIWRRAGFKASPEKFISFPIFLTSLPMVYSPTMDPPNKGLQRATIMTSMQGVALAHVQGDWYGTGADVGGPLLVSRRGQIACIDLFTSESNYNAVTVASSGQGKSFLTNEIIRDHLCRGGRVRLFDIGRSYERLCTLFGGQNITFRIDDPKSLNPLWGVVSMQDLTEAMPLLKTLIRQMAYPLTPEEDTPAYEYSLIEQACTGVWEQSKGKGGLKEVYEWLLAHDDSKGRAKDLASQLIPYAIGRYSQWFNGPRDLDFQNDFTVIELNELNSDPELSSVVLSLLIHHTSQEMYQSNDGRKTLLVIDEAWQLLGGLKTGAYIAKAFRTLRKYNGAAVVVTQSFLDLEVTAAGRAILENSHWQFILAQKDTSIESAAKNDRITNDPGLLKVLKSVKSGPGFSEVMVRSEKGQGVYRFVTDRHTYYTYTTNPKDKSKFAAIEKEHPDVIKQIDVLARRDYKAMFGVETLEELMD